MIVKRLIVWQKHRLDRYFGLNFYSTILLLYFPTPFPVPCGFITHPITREETRLPPKRHAGLRRRANYHPTNVPHCSQETVGLHGRSDPNAIETWESQRLAPSNRRAAPREVQRSVGHFRARERTSTVVGLRKRWYHICYAS